MVRLVLNKSSVTRRSAEAVGVEVRGLGTPGHDYLTLARTQTPGEIRRTQGLTDPPLSGFTEEDMEEAKEGNPGAWALPGKAPVFTHTSAPLQVIQVLHNIMV